MRNCYNISIHSRRFKSQSTILLGLLALFLLSPQATHAATRTWDGGGSTPNWSEDANWSSDIEPVSGDTVVFNSTSVEDSTVDSTFGSSITTLTISSGYPGTTTLARSLTVTTLTFGAGATSTIDMAAQTLTATTFTQNAGTLVGGTGTLDINGAFSQ